MKLIYIIVSSDDDNRVMEQLNRSGFSGTRIATTGGFLRTGNTTLIVGTEEERVGTVIDIVKRECGPRQHIVANTPPTAGAMNNGFVPYPITVDVGGATIFVVDVEQYIRI